MKCETMEKVEISDQEKREVHEKVEKFQEEILASWRKPFQNPSPSPVKIVYCMTFYGERVAQVAKCLKRVVLYVNRCVLVHDGTPKASQIDQLYKLSNRKAEFVYRKWDDRFAKQRNAYLDHVEEGEWVIVSDPDELFSLSFVTDIRTILMDAEKQGINSLLINTHDVIKELDGKTTRNVSNRFKQLIFKYEEGVRYVGSVHETLLPGIHGWRSANLDPRYYYEHHKTMLDIKESGARNVFCGGGGNNVKERNPLYVQWQAWAIAHIFALGGVADWPHMRDYIRKGHIDEDLKQFFIDHRNDSGWDYENESRDPFTWYSILFPEEMKGWESKPEPPSKGSPSEVMAYVEQQYLQILGRKADDKGKQLYTDSILVGNIKREQLPEMLKNSEEYKQKHGTTEHTGSEGW